MFIKNYFTDQQILNNDNPQRLLLGEREMLTIELLAPLVGYKPTESNHWLLADLGCGDQHLKHATEQRGIKYMGFEIYFNRTK